MSADEYFDLSKNPLHSAVGEAIEAYTQVEAALARLLQSILKAFARWHEPDDARVSSPDL